MSHLVEGGSFQFLNKEMFEEEAPPSFLELEIPSEEMDEINRFYHYFYHTLNFAASIIFDHRMPACAYLARCSTVAKYPTRTTDTRNRCWR